MKEEFYADFTGNGGTLTGRFVQEDGNLFMVVPFFRLAVGKKKIRIAGNWEEKLKQFSERPVVNINEGKTGVMKRFYKFSLDAPDDINMTDVNDRLVRENESLLVERNYLYELMLNIKQSIETSGNLDSIRSQLKADFDFIHSLKPGYMMKPEDDKKKTKK